MRHVKVTYISRYYMPCDVLILQCLGLTMYRSVKERGRQIDVVERESESEIKRWGVDVGEGV